MVDIEREIDGCCLSTVHSLLHLTVSKMKRSGRAARDSKVYTNCKVYTTMAWKMRQVICSMLPPFSCSNAHTSSKMLDGKCVGMHARGLLPTAILNQGIRNWAFGPRLSEDCRIFRSHLPRAIHSLSELSDSSRDVQTCSRCRNHQRCPTLRARMHSVLRKTRAMHDFVCWACSSKTTTEGALLYIPFFYRLDFFQTRIKCETL